MGRMITTYDSKMILNTSLYCGLLPPVSKGVPIRSMRTDTTIVVLL